jgi:hypothetical protein
MEILFGIIASGCLGYLITELNAMSGEIKELREDVTWIQAKLDRRETK